MRALKEKFKALPLRVKKMGEKSIFTRELSIFSESERETRIN